MKKFTINNNQFNYLKKLTDAGKINEAKTLIQELFNKQTDNSNFLWQQLNTGVGKTYMTVNLIKEFIDKGFTNILVIVPTDVLKRQWTGYCERLNIEVNIQVINGFSKKLVDENLTYSCDLLVVDEVDRVCNEDSIYFSKLLDIVVRKKTVVLAAILENKHIEFLIEKGLTQTNYLEDYHYTQLKLMPTKLNYVANYELTFNERTQYFYIDRQIEDILNKFSILNLGNRIKFMLPGCLKHPSYLENWAMVLSKGTTVNSFQMKGVIIGYAAKYMRLISGRKLILNNAADKIRVIKQILEKEKKKAFIFCGSIDAVNAICEQIDGVPFHSKLGKKESKKNMIEFLTTDKSIVSIKSLIYGFDLDAAAAEYGVERIDIDLVINHSFNSSKIAKQQSKGRIARISALNPEKVSTTYDLLSKPFQGVTTIEFQDNVWAKKADNNETRYYLDDNLNIINQLEF